MSTADTPLTKYHLEVCNETYTQPNTTTHCRATFTKFTKNSCAGSQSITDRPLILSGTDNHTNAYTLFYLVPGLILHLYSDSDR